MLTRLGRFTVRRRKLVLVATFLLVLVAGALGSGVADRLTAGGFADPKSESEQAKDLLDRQFGATRPNLVLLVTPRRGDVDAPVTADAGGALTRELAREPGVSNVVSYWSLGEAAPLRSRSGDRALVLAAIRGDEDRVNERIKELSPRYTRHAPAVDVAVGGQAEVFRQVSDQVTDDLGKAERIAIPITLLLLVVVFGGIVAAGLPVLVGVLAILGTLLALFAISSITDVSIYSMNLTTALGLGLAIDYSLFVVSRFREELRGGLEPHDAVVRTVETAGRTVAGSALTVAASLGAMLLFPLVFLRSFAYAGIAVSLIAAVGAIVFLPALLAVLGHRVDALQLWKRAPKPVGQGMWHRVATAVMRRPVPIATAAVVLLVVLGIPFLHLHIGLGDDRVLPAGRSSRQVQNVIRHDFASNEAGALEVVAPNADPSDGAALGRYAATLSRLRGVARVDSATGSYVDGGQVPAPAALTERFQSDAVNGTWLSVVPAVEPLSDAGEALAHDVRDATSPIGKTLVAGPGAELVDSKDSLFGRLPWAGAWIAVATFVLLFLMFGSLLVPVKALVLNVLSLSATLGAMVWIFQDGHLSGVLDFTATGSLVATMPVLMFCVAFGLSMDYEVFLLSRIKEEHDRTHDNVASVATGLERTGRIVTAAAVLISVVLVVFATSGVSFIKLFGVGLALAVLMDAFVIRATLVPAFMRLAGEANWWAPRPLARLYERFGIRESEPVVPPTPASVPTPTSTPDADRTSREPVSAGSAAGPSRIET
jgi:putative drug exporter of the RND superfamily